MKQKGEKWSNRFYCWYRIFCLLPVKLCPSYKNYSTLEICRLPVRPQIVSTSNSISSCASVVGSVLWEWEDDLHIVIKLCYFNQLETRSRSRLSSYIQFKVYTPTSAAKDIAIYPTSWYTSHHGGETKIADSKEEDNTKRMCIKTLLFRERNHERRCTRHKMCVTSKFLFQYLKCKGEKYSRSNQCDFPQNRSWSEDCFYYCS